MCKAKSIIIIIAFLLIYSGTNAQKIPGERSPTPGDEKQLLLELKNSKTDTERAEALLNLGAYYLFLPSEDRIDLDKAMQYTQQAREVCARLKFQDGYNEAMVLTGKILHEDGKEDLAKVIFDSLTIYINQAISLSKEYNKPASHARAVRQLADMRLSQNRFTEAEKILLELVDLYRKNGFPNFHYAYERLTLIAIIQGDYNKALLYGLEMMRSMETTKDYASAGSFYSDMGNVYLNLGQFEKGLEYNNIAYDHFKKNRSSLLYDLKADVAETLIKLHRGKEALLQLQETLKEFPPKTNYENKVMERALGNCYIQLKMYHLAEFHLKKSIEIEEKGRYPYYVIYIYKKMAQVYTEWEKYDKAKLYTEKCLKSTVFRTGELGQLHFMMYRIDSAAGNYLSAIKHLSRSQTLADAANKEIKTRENDELQLKYETEKKDRELLVRQQNIELLNKERLLQESRLKQATTSRNIIIGGTAILLLLFVVTWHRYKEKQKNTVEINKKNLALQQLITEKEWLLKEVHHRVKNNLQTVVSLLESQSAYLQDDALLAIQESQNRVHAMSLIHQKLYQSENVAAINMAAYLPELVNYLRDSFNARTIHFNLKIMAVDLDVSQAIPLGLIVNEAITNSIKYAFPGNISSKEINISMTQAAGGLVELKIWDNGIGLARDFNYHKSGSLGLKLIKGLTDDLQGKMQITADAGTSISIQFTANKPLEKINENSYSTVEQYSSKEASVQ